MDLYQSSPADRINPYFAPYLAEDLSGQPDTLVITAEYDPLRDEGEAYAKRLLEAGNHVELHRIRDALHGFFSLPVKFEPVEVCYDYMKEFLGRHSGKEAEGVAEYEEEEKHTLDKA
jgi:acetyl esterase/lipase